MFTHSTELGRRVLLNDWIGFHRDRLLSVLYQMRDSGGDGSGLTLAQISNVTGLDAVAVCTLVQEMEAKPTLISQTIENVIVITKRGVRWVEESPRQHSV